MKMYLVSIFKERKRQHNSYPYSTYLLELIKKRKFTDRKNIVQSRLKCPDSVGAKSLLFLIK